MTKMEIDNRYREFLMLTIHDNGECLLVRSGCRGGEYYKYQDALERIIDFTILNVPCNIGLYFCEGNGPLDYYFPSKEVSKKVILDIESKWNSDLELSVYLHDVPNIRGADGSLDSVQGFYGHKESNMTTLLSVSKYHIEVVNDYEKYVGFSSLGKNMLYVE